MQTLMRQAKRVDLIPRKREPEAGAKAALRLNESSIGVEIDFAHVLRHSGPSSTLGSVPLPLPGFNWDGNRRAQHDKLAREWP